MSKLPSVSGKEVYGALKRNRYEDVRTSASSHRYLKHPDKGGLVAIPFHGNRNLPKGTLKSILKQAGITADDLVNML